MKIAPDFKEFVECVNEHDARYLIVGGYAVAYHGHPRYTKDLDIWIESTEENAERLLNALEDFGFASVGLQVDNFLEPDQIIQLGTPPLRIDLLTSVSGVDFEQCYPRRKLLELDGVSLPFISLDDLKAAKKAAGRHQDLADIENLD